MRVGRRMAAALLSLAVAGALLPAGGLGASALWVRTPLAMGDVNRSEEVDTTDARLTLQYAAKRIKEDGLDMATADVNGDGEVDTTDARLMLQYAARRISDFPCGTRYTAQRSVAETTPNDNPEAFSTATSGNPIFTNIFTADPSAHVWEDGRLYVYASHDIFPSRGCDLMDRYHVFSTDNMVDWVDEGEILSAEDVSWGRESGGFMWAPDCAYKDGTYYFYYPHPCNEEWDDSWRIGVATSDKPAADFTDRGYMLNADGTAVGSGEDPYSGGTFSSFIDPCVFEDEDGSFYLVVGGGGRCYVAKISEDMITLETPLQPITNLEQYHEGPWLFKKDGLYYLMYADGSNEDQMDRMRYAVATSPMGPYTNCGVILDPVENCSTTHGSVVQYKGEWYLFYHNSAISGNGTLRSVCVDKLYFDESGAIQKVIQTKTGVTAVAPASEGTEGAGGSLLIGDGDTSAYSVSADYGLDVCTVTGANYNGTCVENMHISGAKAVFSGIDGGSKGGKALLTVHYSCGQNSDATAKVDTTAGEGYFLRLSRTDSWGDYSGAASCLVDLEPGAENEIVLNGGMGGFNIVYITVSLLPENV